MNFGGTIRINKFGLCIFIGVCVLLFYYLNSDSKSVSDDIKNEPGNTINLRKLLIAAVDVAEKGGKQVYDIRQLDDVKERSKGKLQGNVNDPLTDADDKSHCVMYYSLKQQFPKLKVISEEKPEHCPDIPLNPQYDLRIVQEAVAFPDENVPLDDVNVWIDPLDATKEYTEKLVQYVTTMVCVAVKGKPVIGVIHKPFEDRKTFWAWVGKGVSGSLNTDTLPSKQLKIIVSRSHAGDVGNLTEKAFNKGVKIIQAAGAGYKALEVAERRAAAYIHITHIKKWDVCAGNAILNAVKGKMTTLKGDELDYSIDKSVVNEDGLLATRDKHEWFMNNIRTAMTNV